MTAQDNTKIIEQSLSVDEEKEYERFMPQS